MKNNYLIKEDLKLIIEDSKLSINNLAFEIGVSPRELNYILSDDLNVKFETLDKIYSYAYKKGLRLNKIKEQIFKETTNKLILFHGSKSGLNEIYFNGSRNNCDFGSAFYLGESYSQAINFVYEFKESSVYAFKLDLSELNVYEFETNLEWMLAICYYKGMLEEYKESKVIKNLLKKLNNADVIIAPIADNRMFNVIWEFGEGLITDLQAIHSLSSSNLGKQYVLKTKKAIDKLELIEHLFVCTKEKEVVSSLLIERNNEIETKLKFSKKEFRGKGIYIEDLFDEKIWWNRFKIC